MSAFVENFKAQLAADKKKATVLAALGCVLLVVVGRAFLTQAPAPDEIKAAPRPAPSQSSIATGGPSTAGQGSSPRPPGPPLARTGETATDQPVAGPEKRSTRRVVATNGMPRELARDVFSAQSWTKLASSDGAEGSAARSNAFWSDLISAAVEYRKTQREEAEVVAKELSGLTLQSTMTGSAPAAYVSGRLLHPGDSVFGFSVVRIADRSVILVKHGHEHVLTMP